MRSMNPVMSLTFACGCIAAVVCAAPSAAQDAPPAGAEEEANICLPTLRLWTGSIDEIRAIRTEPLPRSYREGQQSCGGPLQNTDLVGWHLRYGTADTALAAIAFLEARDRDYRRQTAENGRRMLPQVFAEFRRELAAAPPEKLATPEMRNRFYESSAAVSRLELAIGSAEATERPASAYFDVAETFGIGPVRRHLAAAVAEQVRAHARVLDAIEVSTLIANEREALAFVLDRSGLADGLARNRFRLALLDADYPAAQKALADLQQPYFDDVLEYAFQGGRDFCDFPDYVSQEAKDVCNSNWNSRRIVQYGYDKAHLALLRDNDTNPAEEIIEIYRIDRDGSGIWRSHFTRIDRRIVELYLAVAEARYREAGNPAHRGAPSAPRNDFQLASDRQQGIVEALDGFIEAARKIDPALDPVAYRRAAERAIAVDDELRQLEKQYDLPCANCRKPGPMSWIRLTLAHLNEIAEGRIE